MSKLSELLPAGAGAKSAEFVASGTLASGQTVALKTDGTVEAITGQLGTATSFGSGATNSELRTSMCFDPDNNKIIIAYKNASNSGYGTAVVGTVSGISISFGTPVVFSSTNTDETITAAYDTTANKVVMTYPVGATFYAIVGTVSGTSISFGSTVNISSNLAAYPDSVYDSSANKTLVSYTNGSNSFYGTLVTISVSGTTPSFGTPVVVASATTNGTALSYDTTANKSSLVVTNPSGSYLKAYAITISGTAPSPGSATDLGSMPNGSDNVSSAYDPDINRHILVFRDRTSGATQYFGKYIIFQLSGTSIINNTAATAFSDANANAPVVVYDTGSNKVVVLYSNTGAYSTLAKIGTATTGSITFGEELKVPPDAQYALGGVYDPTANKVVIGQYSGTATVLNPLGVPSASFVGITDQAIANTATGSVVVQGGVITNTGLVPLGPVLGTAVVLNAANSSYISSAFDASSNKVVIAYTNTGNNTSTAVVGTVSGSSITYGTPVVFRNSEIQSTSVTFDSTGNKVNITFTNDLNSNRAECATGTVSGTNISFTSTKLINGSNGAGYASSAFDSNANRLVFCWQNTSNSNYGTAAVGQLDGGGQVSFGTPVVFNSSTTEYTSTVFDSNSNKIVVAYDRGSGGRAKVGTVSGTSISFGSEATFNGTQSAYIGSTFDSNSNKVVLIYSDVVGGSCVVGTVSGTSITFGTEAKVGASEGTSFTNMSFDSTNNKVLMAYRGYIGSAYYGGLTVGTVSGTGITVSNEITFNTGNTLFNPLTYDSNAKKTVLTYRDGSDNNYGKSLVINLSSDLTIGTDYFVQANGTLATTTSTVPAGRALSTTSMLLEG